MEELHVVNCDCDVKHNIMKRIVKKKTSESCSVALRWLGQNRIPGDSKEIYESLLSSTLECNAYQESLEQIELDVSRTGSAYFSTEKGKNALKRLLSVYAKYNVELGYVQGMNYIAASLLWHAQESDAFWLFVCLIEDFSLYELFLPNLPGISKHCQIIQLLVFDVLPDLYKQLAHFRVTAEMFAAEWIVSLFGSVVPFNEMVHFLDFFFEGGWISFYKFVIVLLGCLEKHLMKARNFNEFLGALKISKNTSNEWKEFLSKLNLPNTSWSVLLKSTKQVELDEKYINYLHLNFNLETSQFSFNSI